MAKLTDDDLISILRREEMTAEHWQDDRLQGVRQQAFDYYDRNPTTFGVEEGQSSVVTSEVADTVETVMPGLMRVFASGEEIAEFTPIEEADEQAAKEATQYVPHVMMRENDGFRIFYWFLKDALLYRISVLMVDVEEVEKTQRKPVEGATEEEMAAFAAGEEEKGAAEVAFEVESAGMRTVAIDPATGQPVPLAEPVEIFSGTVTVTRKKKRVVVDNIAPEDLRVSPADVRDIDQASYAGYAKETTASQLRMLGLSQDEIDNLSGDRRSSPEEDQRQDGQGFNQPRKDDQRRLWLSVAYAKVDMDGDGISEMWRCVYAHAGGNSPSGALIEKTKWEDPEAPIVIGSAILMPHDIVGRSLADQTMDLQDVGTAITRAMLDNTYQVVRPRPMINTKKVNVLSVLDHTAGMPIHVEGEIANNIAYLQTTSVIEPALAALGYLENKRDQRTGTSRMGNNMDSDALQDASNMTATGTQMVMSAAQERQELMARTLAATAFTRLCRLVYRAIKRCEGGPTKYYAKGEWQNCDPTKWPDDMHLVVSVGTGTGNKQMEMQNLMAVAGAQEKLWLAQGSGPGPALTLEHLANTGRKFAEAAGFRATSQFFATDRDVKKGLEQKATEGPPPSPEMMKVQADAAAGQAKLQADSALAQQKMAADLQQKREAAAIDLQLARERAAQEMQIAREKAALDMQIARERAALDAQLKTRELDQEAALGAMEIKENARVQGAAQQREQEVS